MKNKNPLNTLAIICQPSLANNIAINKDLFCNFFVRSILIVISLIFVLSASAFAEVNGTVTLSRPYKNNVYDSATGEYVPPYSSVATISGPDGKLSGPISLTLTCLNENLDARVGTTYSGTFIDSSAFTIADHESAYLADKYFSYNLPPKAAAALGIPEASIDPNIAISVSYAIWDLQGSLITTDPGTLANGIPIDYASQIQNLVTDAIANGANYNTSDLIFKPQDPTIQSLLVNPSAGAASLRSFATAAPGAPAPPMTACLAFAGVLVLQALRRRKVA